MPNTNHDTHIDSTVLPNAMQCAMAKIATDAILANDVIVFLNQAATIIAKTLNVAQIGIFEQMPSEQTLKLIAAKGLTETQFRTINLLTKQTDQVAASLHTSNPIIVPNLKRETFYHQPPFVADIDALSCITMRIQQDTQRAFGVLALWDSQKQADNLNACTFLKQAASILAKAIAQIQQNQLTQFQIHFYEQIAAKRDLHAMFDELCIWLESKIPHTEVALLLVEEEKGDRARLIAGPHLMPELVIALERLTSENNIEDVTRQFGIRTCWSTSILDSQQQIVGTLVVLHHTTAAPTQANLHLLKTIGQLIGHAITQNRHHWMHQRLENTYAELKNKILAQQENKAEHNQFVIPDEGNLAHDKSLLRYHELFEDVKDLIQIIDPSGNITFANRAWRQAFGYGDTAIPDLKIFDIAHPTQRQLWRDLLRRALAGEKINRFESKFVTRKGQILIIESIAYGFVVDGKITSVRCISWDITQQSHVKQEYKKFAALVQCSSELIAMASMDGRLSFINDAGRKLVGLKSNESPTKLHLKDFHAPSTWSCLQEIAMPAIRQMTHWEGEGELRPLHQNKLIDVDINIFVVRQSENDMPCCIALVERDISQAKRIGQMKDDMISTVSHELRTPLTSLRGYTELLLKRDFEPSKQTQFLKIIHEETLRLNRLITDFLDVRRMEAGRQTYQMELIDLTHMLHKAIKLFSQNGKHFQWKLNLPATLPPVLGDRDRLWQVLSNLITNAMKFAPQASTLTLTAEQQDAKIIVQIQDQGIGISEADQLHLFEKFYRAQDSPEYHQGSGLGLSIVKEIVEAHEGHVWLESVVNRGSSFFFSLPIA